MTNEYVAGLGLLQLLKDKTRLTGAEIGVNQGITSEFLLKNLNLSRLYLIDPWKGYGVDNKNAGSTHFTDEDALQHYKETIERVKFAKEKVAILNMTSEKASTFVPDESLDFVFIDGDHSFNAVVNDFETWWPKVKMYGLFTGHDFSHGDVNKALRQHSHIYKFHYNLGVNDIWWGYRTR